MAKSFMAGEVERLKDRSQTHAEATDAENIHDYFQDVHSWLATKGVECEHPAPWHQFPPSYNLVSHVLTRGPTILDLWPESVEAFEARRQIPAGFFLKLCEAGAIIPDIYVRDENKWNLKGPEYGYLHKMFRKAENDDIKVTMKGQIVDEFISKKFGDYRSDIHSYSTLWRGHSSEKMSELVTAYNELPGVARVKEGPLEERFEDVLIPIAHTHAYVAAFCEKEPESVESKWIGSVENKLTAGNFREALQELYTLKRLKASPITAALGGTLYWTKDARDVALRDPDLLKSIGGDSTSLDNMKSSGWRKEIQELATTHLVSHIPRLSDDQLDDKIIDRIKNSDLHVINAKLQEFERALVLSANVGEDFSMSEEEWSRYLRDRKRIFNKFEISGEIVGFSLAVAALVVAPIMVTAVPKITGAGKVAGQLTHRVFLGGHHRLLDAVSEVEKLAGTEW